MEKVTHQIRTQCLELSFDNESKASDLPQRVIDLCQNELQRMMEPCLDDSCPSDKIIRFKRVEINIGDIDLNDLRSEWPQRVTKALRVALADALRNATANGVEITTIHVNPMDSIAHYLRFGYLPWSDHQADVATLLQSALKQEPDALAYLLRTLCSSLNVRMRIVERFSSDRLCQLISVLEPGHANEMIAYHNHLLELNRKEEIVVAQQNVLEKTLWLFLFNYLLVERHSLFNAKSYAKSILQQFAFHFNIAFDDLVSLIVAALPKWKGVLPSPFAGVITEILHELPRVTNSILPREATYGKRAQIPDSLEQVVTRMNEEIELKEETLIRFVDEIKRYRNKAPLIRDLLDRSDERMAARIVRCLLPEEASNIEAYHKCVVLLHGQDPIANISQREVGNTVWTLIILHLLDHQGSYFNQKYFLKALIHSVASHYNLSAQTFLERLMKSEPALKALPSAITEFMRLVHEIYSEYMGSHNITALPKKSDQKNQSVLQQLEAVWKGLDNNSRQYEVQLPIWVHQVLQREPVQFAKILKKYLGKYHVRKQLASIAKSDFQQILLLIIKSPVAEMLSKATLFLESITQQMLSCFGTDANYQVAVNTAILEVAHSLNGTLREPDLLYLIFDKLASQHRGLQVNELMQLHDEHNNKPKHGLTGSPVGKKVGHKNDLKNSLAGIENYIQLLMEGASSNQLRDRGFHSVDDATQFFSKYYPHKLKQIFGKVGEKQKENFVESLSSDSVKAIFYSNGQSDHSQYQLLLNAWSGNLSGLPRGDQLLNEMMKIILIAEVTNTAVTHERILKSLLRLFNRYQVPDVFFERLAYWSLPASGDASEAIRFIERKVQQAAHKIKKEDRHKARLKILRESAEGLRQSQIHKEEQTCANEPIFICNAGLVLTHTYFVYLFDQCHLLSGGNFKDTHSQIRAISLLHYAVAGNEDYSEEVGVLYKVLCGVPVSTVISRVVLSKREKKLVNEMLHALTIHWPVISNSTPDEVRGNWLVRDGKLLEREDYWELTVERKSYDLLLDTLPFTLSPLKYPWITKRVSINWL